MRARALTCVTLMLAFVMLLPGASRDVFAGEERSLETQYRAAAEKYDVPVAVLKAMGYTNTRWEMPSPQASDFEDSVPGEGEPDSRGAYGLMSLYQNPSKDTLGRAAEITGIPEEQLKADREANIEGAAAVLSEMQGDRPESINGWYETVAQYGDGALYADQVYETLKNGTSLKISTGERVVLEAHPEAGTQAVSSYGSSGADYGRAAWHGTNGHNYTNANRGAKKINKIVIHTTQGSWAGAISWFKNPRAQSSAHYTVRSSDGAIGQSVREEDIPWHAGNWSYNESSIGIEHEGYVSDPRWYTKAMYRSSAKLSAHLAKKYGIPIDRKHIIGHGQVPYPNTHTDPGPHWKWDKYIKLVRRYAGGGGKGSGGRGGGKHRKGGSGYKQVVDNSYKRFSASGSWGASRYDSQRYKSNYRFIRPKAVSEKARYKFKTPRRGRYAVYAWWPANGDYNWRTKFWILTKSGWKKEVRSQRKNGGRWVRLGSYKMGKGDRVRVKISRKSSARGLIVADAVKIRKL